MSDAPQGFPGCENWGNEELYVCLAPGSSLPTLTRAPFLGRALLELVEQVQPTAAQLSQWCALRRTLEQFLQREFGAGTRLRFFGSVVAGLARADSDLDLCLAVEPGRGALDLTGSEVPTAVVLSTLGRLSKTTRRSSAILFLLPGRKYGGFASEQVRKCMGNWTMNFPGFLQSGSWNSREKC
eukprot:RCo024582